MSDSRVRMLDLSRQLEPLAASLGQAASDVIRSGWFLFGKRCESFEKAFAAWLGVDNAVACANGTDALTLALWANGIGEGACVVTVPNTAFATACGITRAGARPVFVDIDPETWLIDIEAAADAAARASRTQCAVIPVHLYGHAVDVPALMGCVPRGTIVIEDCAQAHGATLKGQKVGTFSDVSAFSFYPSKNLCALGDAGLVAMKGADHAEKVRQMRFYGQESRDRHTAVGMNSRMDEIQAAFLEIELGHLDAWVERRRKTAAMYDAGLPADVFRRPRLSPDSVPSYHLYVVMVEERGAFREALLSEGIETGVHYPEPIHTQPAYRDLGYASGDFPNAERLARRIVSLPVAPHLDDGEADRVLEACVRFARAGGS